MGEITLAVPQVREGGFYPSALEKGLRSERPLSITLAEMYVQGVSTRKVKVITKQLCGVGFSATQVSRATAQLDETLQQWRERPRGEITYLYLDARYEKVREDGPVRDAVVLVSSGLTPEGERPVLELFVPVSRLSDRLEETWRIGSQSLILHSSAGDSYAPPTAWSGLMKRSARAPGWRASFKRSVVHSLGFGIAAGNQRGVANRKTVLCWQVLRLL